MLFFPEVFLNLLMREQITLDNHQGLEAQQSGFTELTLGQEKFERGISTPEEFYYFINVPKGNFKAEVSWLGVFYTLKVDLTLANDSGFTQIIASSTGNQGRSAILTFNIDQERTIFLNVSLPEDFLFTVDIKILIKRNVTPLNVSLITLIVAISLTGTSAIAIIYWKRKKSIEKEVVENENIKNSLMEAKKLVEIANNEYIEENYSNAIKKWKNAEKTYLGAINEAFMFTTKKTIMENVHTIRINLCEGYFKLSESQVKNAEDLVIQNRLYGAIKELLSARESIQTAMMRIRHDKVKIDDENYRKQFDLISSRIKELNELLKPKKN
jgi:hypothetical protein